VTHEFYTLANSKEAKLSKHASDWKKAMDDEIASLMQNKTWYLCPHPAGTLGLEIHQMDIELAFLHAPINKEIYITQPEGYIDPKFPNHICHLRKSLYGLKQALYEWNQMLNQALINSGFEPIEADACVYVKWMKGMIAIITIHVDNCLILANSKLLKTAKSALSSKFKVKDLGEVKSVLGMELICNQQNGCLLLRQRGCIDKILSCFGMSDLKPLHMLMAIGLSLPKLTATAVEDQHLPFWSAIRKLSYLTRTG
jgi:hypothetical protein